MHADAAARPGVPQPGPDSAHGRQLSAAARASRRLGAPLSGRPGLRPGAHAVADGAALRSAAGRRSPRPAEAAAQPEHLAGATRAVGGRAGLPQGALNYSAVPILLQEHPPIGAGSGSESPRHGHVMAAASRASCDDLTGCEQAAHHEMILQDVNKQESFRMARGQRDCVAFHAVGSRRCRLADCH